ncbi:MAG: transporter [Acidimicrobiales bacterium]|nr:transporter [Acidimicrobiales bacterium]
MIEGRPARQAATYGAMTMVALCFANGLQGGEIQGVSQATESLRHSFHVGDTALGALQFFCGMAGAFGAVWIGSLCVKHARTRVLTGMFLVWTIFMGLNALSATFVMFILVRLVISVSEATDPPVYPLIGDFWPHEQRAQKVSIFNAGAGVGAFIGIAGAGLLVDRYGWQAMYLMWVPFGALGTYLMWRQREPERGAQDAAAELSDEAAAIEAADEDLVAALMQKEDLDRLAEEVALPGLLDPATASKREILRHILHLRTWRLVALGIGVAQIMLNGLMFWGIPYFKRTYHYSGAKVAALTPLIGGGAFAGVIVGGFLSDRLLKRGMVRARVLVAGLGYVAGGAVLVMAFSTRMIWVSAPLIALGTAFAALATGPQYALLVDVAPVSLREQATGIGSVVQFVSAIGYVLVGALSDLFGNNLRLALLATAPAFCLGGAMILVAGRTYIADVAMVVAEARRRPAGDR